MATIVKSSIGKVLLFLHLIGITQFN